MVHTFLEEMTLNAAGAIKMTLDEGAARMKGKSPLPECVRQGINILALAKVAEEWVREAGGVEPGGGNATE